MTWWAVFSHAFWAKLMFVITHLVQVSKCLLALRSLSHKLLFIYLLTKAPRNTYEVWWSSLRRLHKFFFLIVAFFGLLLYLISMGTSKAQKITCIQCRDNYESYRVKFVPSASPTLRIDISCYTILKSFQVISFSQAPQWYISLNNKPNTLA